MRLSCLAFARLANKGGQYAVLLNRGRLKYHGQRLLSPIGGGLQFDRPGKAALERFSAHHFDEVDLRFYAPDPQLTAIRRWFRLRTEREISVMRELREELVDESGVLTAQDLRGARERFAGFREFIGNTARNDARERRTVYLIEVYNITLPQAVLEKLELASKVPAAQRQLYFVSRGQIRNQIADGITSIGPITQTIL